MGKEGPCYHCGVTSTPLWRNGPPEKPILCNACGSRWRIKGTLSNYTPLHFRAKEDVKMKKRKLNSHNSVVKKYAFKANYREDFLKMKYEDTGNLSSSSSAVSNSERDASNSTVPSQSFAMELQVPSKKRKCVTHTNSSCPVEKLIKDLHAIMHEHESSCLSWFSEEDLLLESNEPMVSVEIGHGSVLIKHPSSMVREEESKATSSLSAINVFEFDIPLK
ncbi:hypothetical protein V2J09_020722 [Rumex salicifolius]